MCVVRKTKTYPRPPPPLPRKRLSAAILMMFTMSHGLRALDSLSLQASIIPPSSGMCRALATSRHSQATPSLFRASHGTPRAHSLPRNRMTGLSAFSSRRRRKVPGKSPSLRPRPLHRLPHLSAYRSSRHAQSPRRRPLNRSRQLPRPPQGERPQKPTFSSMKQFPRFFADCRGPLMVRCC